MGTGVNDPGYNASGVNDPGDNAPESDSVSGYVFLSGRAEALEPNAGWRGQALVSDVARIPGGRRLEEDNLCFVFGRGAMFEAARHDQEFARGQLDCAISKLHAHSPPPDQKHLVRVVVMMPDKFTLELYDLHFLSV